MVLNGDQNKKETSKWSATNIGFSDQMPAGEDDSPARRKQRADHHEYIHAVAAAQKLIKPYVAEATHFRFKYPHTLGRITALSRARNDQAREEGEDSNTP